MGVTGGSTDVSVVIRILDSSDGTPEQGVTSATAGLALWYRREGAALVALTEDNLAALTDAHADGKMLHIDDGYYRVDIPDAAFAAGVRGVQIGGAATDMVVFGPYIEIDPPADVTRISGDSTAADNLESACDGGSYNVGGGSVVAASVTGAVGSVTGNVGGNVAGSVGSVTGAVGSVTGAVGSVTAGVTLADDAITAAKYDETTAYPVKSADTGATQIARVGADGDTLETLSDQLDAVETDTGEIGAAGAGLTALGDARLANLDAAVSSRSSHAAADVWGVGTRTLTSFGTLASDAATAVWAAGTRTITGLTQAALALFATTDTGEASAVAGSVAALAQGEASDLTTAGIADAVWDEATADHTTSTTYGGSVLPVDVWTYSTRTLTQSAASVAAVVAGTTITEQRGDTWSIALTSLGAVTSYGNIWFTVKEERSDTDAQSVVQIDTDTGLLYLNGAAGTAGQGSITVDDESAGDITIALAAAASDDLTPGTYEYDVQWQNASGTITTLTTGVLIVQADITRAVS